jgi:putative flippase GtrA
VDIRGIYHRLKNEVAKFGAVGLIAYVIDVSIFNLLLNNSLSDKPLTSKTISAIVATTFAYFGNRFWTFRDRARTSYRKEYVLFVVLNGVGMGIQLTCLATSHYLLDFTSALADNISGNGIGLVFGTLFRFWSYRKWVFLAQDSIEDSRSQISN